MGSSQHSGHYQAAGRAALMVNSPSSRCAPRPHSASANQTCRRQWSAWSSKLRLCSVRTRHASWTYTRTLQGLCGSSRSYAQTWRDGRPSRSSVGAVRHASSPRLRARGADLCAVWEGRGVLMWCAAHFRQCVHRSPTNRVECTTVCCRAPPVTSELWRPESLRSVRNSFIRPVLVRSMKMN
jgi:hypothetical protein